jgi:hypothetical protein
MVRHKTFISYHHANDQQYKDWLIDNFGGEYFIDHSVGEGDIGDGIKTETIRQNIRDKFLRDSTVTLVLIGTQTWQRKHVDWEIASSIRHTQYNSRSGLVGLILPTHPDFGKDNYNPGIIPPRLHYNIACGYASIYHFPVSSLYNLSDWQLKNAGEFLEKIIHEAYNKRTNSINNGSPLPDNSYPSFINNRSSASWC